MHRPIITREKDVINEVTSVYKQGRWIYEVGEKVVTIKFLIMRGESLAKYVHILNYGNNLIDSITSVNITADATTNSCKIKLYLREKVTTQYAAYTKIVPLDVEFIYQYNTNMLYIVQDGLIIYRSKLFHGTVWKNKNIKYFKKYNPVKKIDWTSTTGYYTGSYYDNLNKKKNTTIADTSVKNANTRYITNASADNIITDKSEIENIINDAIDANLL